MKKSVRTCMIMHILSESPNTDFPLGFFSEKFTCAKSSISEDLKLVKEAFEASGSGTLITSIGAKGGVRFVPDMSDENIRRFLTDAAARFSEPDRLMGSGFLYTSDIMFDPGFAYGAGRVFAKHFAKYDADFVMTVETKGIAVAEYAAQLLGLPLVVARRESKISDGSTVSINYISGSSDRIQKMSLSKRAIKSGSGALIIDDFVRGGGSVNGLCNMLAEFDSRPLAAGAVLAVDDAKHIRVEDFYPLLLIHSKEMADGVCKITVNM